jgi:hypothetical protein
MQLVMYPVAAHSFKDFEPIAVLLERELVDVGIARERIASVSELHMLHLDGTAADRPRE